MNKHRLDTDVDSMTDDQILKRCLQNPVRIPMMDMRALVDLREKGFVICGQEMENCIAIHAHDGDRIIEGTPTTFAWVVITPKGREYLHSQGYMVPDEYGTVKVPRASQPPGGMAITAREQATIADRVGASMEEIMMQPDPRAFIESRLHEADLPGEIIGTAGIYEHINIPMEYKAPSPDVMQTLDAMDRARILTAGINGEDLDD